MTILSSQKLKNVKYRFWLQKGIKNSISHIFVISNLQVIHYFILLWFKNKNPMFARFFHHVPIWHHFTSSSLFYYAILIKKNTSSKIIKSSSWWKQHSSHHSSHHPLLEKNDCCHEMRIDSIANQMLCWYSIVKKISCTYCVLLNFSRVG